jgi:diguanylate cyclase (GGDEF)-like protein
MGPGALLSQSRYQHKATLAPAAIAVLLRRSSFELLRPSKARINYGFRNDPHLANSPQMTGHGRRKDDRVMVDGVDTGETWPPGRHLLPLFAVAALCLSAAFIAWFSVSNWEARLDKAAFTSAASDYGDVLQRGLDDYLSKLATVHAFYDSSVEVERSEFERFTGHILYDQGSAMRITWSPYVNGAEREEFVRKVRRSGLVDFDIEDLAANGGRQPVPERSSYFPVLYATPDPNLRPVIGLDRASDPARREALERARDGARMATMPDILLRGVSGNPRGFFVALPVYRRGMPHKTVEERRRNIEGILGGSFQTAMMVDAILREAKLPGGVDLYLFAADAESDAAPELTRALPATTGPIEPRPQAALASLPHWQGRLAAGDARWTLVVTPHGGRLTSFYRTWIVVSFTVLVFGVMLAFMWASARYALRLEDANSKVLALAETDLLTNLANRRAFLKRLTQAFAAGKEGAPGFAVLYIDVDDFKDVNDTLGHPMGDALLQEIVVRLKQAVREHDVVARFGGDEFAILQFNVAHHAAVATLATRVVDLMGRPFDVGGHRLHITSSVGISVFSPGLTGPEAMMMQADVALYDAKDEGRNCFRFHSFRLDQQVHERVKIAEDLRSALKRNELLLYYQPQVDMVSGRITGFEALLRWDHPTRGLLLPSSFMAIAERTGSLPLLGRWVLDEACRQLKLWRDQGLPRPVMSVNVSAVQLKGGSDLVREVRDALAAWDVDPEGIELELTETVLMEATQKHSAMLQRLYRLGAKIAIDDFGTGYSSFKYLPVLPLNRLKLARELVNGVTCDRRHAVAVQAVIRLAQELSIDVVAEGVETEVQAEFLVAAGCRQAQGFLFSRPVDASRATELLRQGRIKPAPAMIKALRSKVA